MHILDPFQWQVIGKYHFADTSPMTRINQMLMCPMNLFNIVYTSDSKFYMIHIGNFGPRKIKEVQGAHLMIANDCSESSTVYYGHPNGQISEVDS